MERRGFDRSIGTLADLQHGLVTKEQTGEAGMTQDQLETRLASGRLQRRDSNVYRLAGAPVTWHQNVLAACLASGGVASHRTAAMLHDLGRWTREPVEITIPRGRNYRNPRVFVHRSVDDPYVDARTIDGIPVTSVRRTLVDLGSVVSPDRVEKCVERALFRGKASASALWTYLDEIGRQGRRGVQPLRAVLELRGRLAPAESDLETEMIQLIRRAGLPAPVRQLDVVVASRRFRLDLAYPELKIAIEIDGDEPHFGARRKDHDSTRDGLLQLDHWLTQHFTKRHIRHDEHATTERLRAAIGARSHVDSPAWSRQNDKKTG